MVKPIGCTYESPKSRLDFIRSMPEVYAMISFFITVGITYISYFTLSLSWIISLSLCIAGCLFTRSVAVGGVSPYVVPQLCDPSTLFTDDTRPVAIVTGASSGIGMGTAKTLASQGIYVIMAVRDIKKGALVREAILAELGISLEHETNAAKIIRVMELDLNDMSSVQRFVKEFLALKLPLHFLINNAGAMVTSYKSITGLTRPVDNSFTTNHLGHFLLTTSLLPVILQYKTRIVNVSSAIHVSVKEDIKVTDCLMAGEKTWDAPTAYGRTKICNIWFTNILQQVLDRLQIESGVINNNTQINNVINHAIATAVHPGTVWTPFHMPYYRDTFGGALLWFPIVMGPMSFFSMKSCEEGALTSVHCAIAKHPAFEERHKLITNEPSVGPQPGQFHAECKVSAVSPVAYDQQKSIELWNLSLELVSKYLNKDNCEYYNKLQL